MTQKSPRSRRWFGALLLAVSGVLAGVLGCQGIADIPEVSYSPLCKQYCDLEFSTCTSTDAQYPDYPTCMQVCGVLEANAPGSALENANTVQCRIEQVRAAIRANPERQAPCAASGPGGGTLCVNPAFADEAPDCEGYCTLYNYACHGNSKNPFNSPELGNDKSGDLNTCIDKCRAIQPAKHASLGDAPEVPGYDYHSGALSGDTLGCRIYYASLAVVDPSYCEEAGIRPSGACLGSGKPNCVDYCRALGVACSTQLGPAPTDDLRVYENDKQCEAVCNATEAGTKQDVRQVDTIGCRSAHEFNALLINPKDHCPHISPLGAGVCGTSDTGIVGGNCEAFCSLAAAACENFKDNYPDPSDCEEECADFAGADGNYNVKLATAGGNNLQCRTLNVSRALEYGANPKTKSKVPEACLAVFGGGMCSDSTESK